MTESQSPLQSSDVIRRELDKQQAKWKEFCDRNPFGAQFQQERYMIPVLERLLAEALEVENA